MTVLGIDIGGHAIKAGIVTNQGKVLDKSVILTEAEKGRKKVVSNIINVAEYFLEKDPTVTGIGIGVPGIVERNGFVKFTPNIPLSNFDLGAELKKAIKKRMVFGNDADNFALAIQHFDSNKGESTIVGLTLGTGVGSGIILKGKLFSNNGAPELGHTTIKFDGPKANCCGNDGCIESFIGRKHFAKDPLKVYKKALAGDKPAIKKFEDYGRHLGIAIANFINIFNPDLVVLGGEMSNAYELFRKTMEEEASKRSIFHKKIVKSDIREAGLVGAAVLAF